MSYRITYGPKVPKKYYKRKMSKRPLLFLGVAAAAVIAAAILFPTQAQRIKYKLMPWTTPESKAAISAMLTDIEGGASYSDAIAAFCRDILNTSYGS